jgi:hypothetical protein
MTAIQTGEQDERTWQASPGNYEATARLMERHGFPDLAREWWEKAAGARRREAMQEPRAAVRGVAIRPSRRGAPRNPSPASTATFVNRSRDCLPMVVGRRSRGLALGSVTTHECCSNEESGPRSPD